jgi:RNA polymerase sigma-70 factor (ECF subfamily)
MLYKAASKKNLPRRDRFFLGVRKSRKEGTPMADSVSTRPSLLVRIRDHGDRRAWAEFVDLYAPMVYRYVQRQGLQEADAADLTQEVLRAVARAVPRLEYDPQRGSFRGWLFAVVRNKLRDWFAARRRQPPGTGDSAIQDRLEQQPAPGEDWEADYERQLFAVAVEQVRGDFQESTWQAFWLTAVHGKSGKEVSAILDMTTAAVYLAKRRVVQRLKEQIAYLRSE